jgi:hypothetical protein
MRGWAIILALLLASCERAPAVVFKDAAINLPDDPLDLPPGPGRQAVIENCTACHSPSTMLQQPKVSTDKWQSIVGKMITVYKAPVDEEAIPAIVEYMVAVQAVQDETSITAKAGQ